jgi:MtN3 and saliva related transmembrane protein
MLITLLGLAAAVLTSLSYIPQVRKAWPKGSTDELSFKTLIILAAGLGLWILYGVFQKDWVIVIANSVGCALVALLLAFKMRDTRDDDRAPQQVTGR